MKDYTKYMSGELVYIEDIEESEYDEDEDAMDVDSNSE